MSPFPQVLIASMVTRASGRDHRSKNTFAALCQLQSACDLFENAAAYGGRAVKFLVIDIYTNLLNVTYS
jgi:hypothetical protein